MHFYKPFLLMSLNILKLKFWKPLNCSWEWLFGQHNLPCTFVEVLHYFPTIHFLHVQQLFIFNFFNIVIFCNVQHKAHTHPPEKKVISSLCSENLFFSCLVLFLLIFIIAVQTNLLCCIYVEIQQHKRDLLFLLSFLFSHFFHFFVFYIF